MAVDIELCYADLATLGKLLRGRSLSSVELLTNALQRLSDTHAALNAFTHIDAEGALAAAEACDEHRARQRASDPALHALHGIPVSVKELIEVRGLPCRYGSQTRRDHVAVDDAPSVARMRAAGAVIIGMTNTSEYGFRGYTDNLLHGVSRNPWDTLRTPGGSSGGAASSVAAGVTPVALATDGGGSIRNPASFTGLVGIKAQFGRVPVYPASATPTLAHVGPLARNAADAQCLLCTIMGPDLRDPTSLQGALDEHPGLDTMRALRIAFSPTLGYGKVDQDVAQQVNAALPHIEAQYGPITHIDQVCDDLTDVHVAEFIGGCSARLGSAVDERPETIDPMLLKWVRDFRQQPAQRYVELLQQRLRFRDRMQRFFDDWDVLLTPMTPCTAWRVGERAPPGYESYRMWTFFGFPFNLSGQPAATLPCGFNEAGLPVGLQIVVRQQHEQLLFDLLAGIEALLEVPTRRPPL